MKNMERTATERRINGWIWSGGEVGPRKAWNFWPKEKWKRSVKKKKKKKEKWKREMVRCTSAPIHGQRRPPLEVGSSASPPIFFYFLFFNLIYFIFVFFSKIKKVEVGKGHTSTICSNPFASPRLSKMLCGSPTYTSLYSLLSWLA